MWNFNGKQYTRREFYDLLLSKGQIKPLSKCRASFRREYENDSIETFCAIYTTPSGSLFAVTR